MTDSPKTIAGYGLSWISLPHRAATGPVPDIAFAGPDFFHNWAAGDPTTFSDGGPHLCASFFHIAAVTSELPEQCGLILRFYERDCLPVSCLLGPSASAGLLASLRQAARDPNPPRVSPRESLGLTDDWYGIRVAMSANDRLVLHCRVGRFYRAAIFIDGRSHKIDRFIGFLSELGQTVTSPMERWLSEKQQLSANLRLYPSAITPNEAGAERERIIQFGAPHVSRTAPVDLDERYRPLRDNWFSIVKELGKDPHTGLPVVLVRYQYRGLFLRTGTTQSPIDSTTQPRIRRRNAIEWCDKIHSQRPSSPNSDDEITLHKWRSDPRQVLIDEQAITKVRRRNNLEAATQRWEHLKANEHEPARS
ncbi:MAG: hypothetical protein HOM37_07200 [Acidimicrobiaceae bacterium]|nr:hypothetical protein [Acidimicrobiaceae bacterium]